MLPVLKDVWHVSKASVLTLGGVAFLVLIVRGIFKGETPLRYGGMVHRIQSPLSFWFFVGLYLLLGLALVGAGIASF